MTSIPGVADANAPAPQPREVHAHPGRGDRYFNRGASLSGLTVLSVMAAVGIFLGIQAWQALKATGFSFLTTAEWQPDTNKFGIAEVMLGTVLIALVAGIVAFPIAMSAALFITEVAPKWLRSSLVALVDLMAAVPSVVYGLWGLFLLQGQVVGVSRWINTWFGWIPFFAVDGADPNNPLAAATVDTCGRNRGGDDGHADPVRGDARSVFAGSGRRARGRVCAGLHPLGNDPRCVDPVRSRRHYRWHDARPWTSARRDHCSVADHQPRVSDQLSCAAAR